jgi:hypothetical protein
LSERDERIIEFMRQGRPVAVIAELEGLEPDYCRKATRRLSADYCIDYNPDREPVTSLLGEASRRFRNNIANVLYQFRNKPCQHPLAVARDTGLTQAQQILASERGGRHNFKLTELERLAVATEQDFTRMMIIALLKGTTEADQLRLQRVLACLNS